jgi:hypothetical protein
MLKDETEKKNNLKNHQGEKNNDQNRSNLIWKKKSEWD